ncbi:Uncharacterised protein [Capnocytophaga canimorsus]|nr:hypothetical protein CLV61_0049 [Capnocytophaga canimorsus]STA72624.1 Uncharacterised protein [Capnocytophaga canimorsus]
MNRSIICSTWNIKNNKTSLIQLYLIFKKYFYNKNNIIITMFGRIIKSMITVLVTGIRLRST